MTDPFRTLGDVEDAGPLVITCEHASNFLPPPLVPSDSERELLDTHRGWDIGAGNIVEELVRATGSVGILSHFSRLFCDPNRLPTDPSWIPCEVDGTKISFNRKISPQARALRLQHWHTPYHRAIESTILARKEKRSPFALLSVHSFTPRLGDEIRAMEAGVLFDAHEEAAHQLRDALVEVGFDCALNEPYSGLDGLIYSASLHGLEHGLLFLELELSNDLIDTPPKAHQVATRVAQALERVSWPQAE